MMDDVTHVAASSAILVCVSDLVMMMHVSIRYMNVKSAQYNAGRLEGHT